MHKGSDATAAGGGVRELSEWQRSTDAKVLYAPQADVGHRNRRRR